VVLTYTPPLLKKVIEKYVGIDDMYSEAKRGFFEFTSFMSSWAIYIVESLDNNLEFHIIKNGNQDFVKKMGLSTKSRFGDVNWGW
jgi:hypothetical protein